MPKCGTKNDHSRISVVTPTLGRPNEVEGLLTNLSQQAILPYEVILVDGAAESDRETETVVSTMSEQLPFFCYHIRHGGGTAIQRNAGIDIAAGDFIGFIDDDIRLEPDFFEEIIKVFLEDKHYRVGGIAGYITNEYFDPNTSPRWRWYRRLQLFTTYEPGRYDFQTGYPINRYSQPPHQKLREIDFMGTECGVWRSRVFEKGLRFDEFFVDYGVLEDAHLALRASRDWLLLECGPARCIHLHSQASRENIRLVARKTATNYYYVFRDIVQNRTWKEEFRFWRVQLFDLTRFILRAILYRNKDERLNALGKIEGIISAVRMAYGPQSKNP